ncbi:MAG: DNA polymerase III subunit [Bacteroidia bacterium]
MQFRDIPGLEEIKQRLKQGVLNGRVPHAQLFLGPEGSANLALAWAFVQYMCCENRNEEDSCGICNSCHKVSRLIHPDLHFSFPTVGAKALSTSFMEQWRTALEENPYMEVVDWIRILDSENKQGNITADECRDIIRRLSMKSFESEYRFLILWMPEYLGKEGNTLLKLIEEPPDKTLFILVANNQEEIITTIRSRTQLVKVPRFTEAEVGQYLVEHHLAQGDQKEAIGFMSEGNLNRAIELSAAEDSSFFTSFRSWLLACYYVKTAEMLQWSDQTSGLGRENQKQLLEYGIKLLREVILFRNQAPGLIKISGTEREFVEKFAQLVNDDMLEKMTALMSEYAYFIERNANPKIALFHLSLLFKNILASSRAR